MAESNMKKWVALAFLGVAVAMPSWAGKVSMETATANSVVGLMPQGMAPIWSKAGMEVQLAMDQTLTKSLLKIGQGNLDSSVVPPPAYSNLVAGKGPYAQLGEKGTALAKNVTGLWGFTASNYHPIVWADSGITDWSKIKGKRVYLGPPAGAANAQIRALIKAASGFEDGKDYEGIKAPWGAAPQSYKDGQFDVLVLPATVGSQAVVEMALTRNIRILPMPADAKPKAELGMVASKIPAGTYKGQVNSADVIPTWQTVMMVVANKSMSDADAYLLTKTYVESRSELAKGNALLKELASDDPLGGVIAPLHPGAARYYKEVGIAIPAELSPRP